MLLEIQIFILSSLVFSLLGLVCLAYWRLRQVRQQLEDHDAKLEGLYSSVHWLLKQAEPQSPPPEEHR